MKKIYLLLFSIFFLAGQTVWSQCTNSSAFGTITAPTNNTPATITTCAFGGEYSTINGCTAGSTYLFTATGGSGNFITIHQGTPGGTVLGFGNSPVSVVCTVSGPLYLHYNTNAACGTESQCHTGVIQCTSCSGPPPITNDLCTQAININCGQTISGSTVGATIDAVGTCVTTLGTAPGVWYSFVGNGTSNTLSLCGSGYDTKIGVFTGTCAALTCVTGNDDFCGLQSQVTFNTVAGTTYYVLVTGFSTATGAFTLARTCVAPVNDICTGAVPITCTQTIVGSTSGATLDAVPTCVTSLNTAPGVWYSFPGDGFSTTLSLCGSAYDTKIGVFSGTCGALVCVTGNDDFCGLQSQVTFTSVVGTNYFVLVTGFSTNSGLFTLARSCVLPPCLPSTITPAAATICQGIIQQLTSSSANPGNPGHIWAPVTELFTDALATVPYTGTATNTVYARPSITRTYTATLSSTSCTPTPASVTITVNPNPAVVIVADPGTTICEGDPTLLTVRLGTASPIGTLYTQGNVPVDGSPSQVFEPANAAFTSQAADDFTVPAGTVWTVSSVTANGFGTGNPTSVNVFFYNNSGANLPGTVVASYNNVASFVRTGPNYVVTLPSALNLAAGTYWVSIQVNMSFATGGQWFWGNFGTTNIGNQYAWQNPGGGFATPCTSWGYGATGCNVGGGVNRNNVFSIVGSSLADGGPLPGGYTFLWSPAAGLSSTTSNPVAASPMNTTTYTVTATTPGGCTRTASILITVNKRPTVTTQPTSRANCNGTSASFTVAGTGTNLTYQWQVSTTGCAGPWTNLTNTAPYSGVTTATLTVNPVTVAMNGYAYRAVLSGACAAIGTANISSCAVLTVNPNPVVTVTPTVSCGSTSAVCNAITASGADTYTWLPIAGLFLDCAGTIPYIAGTNAATVYARPTVFTAYTVTGTLTATGCFSTATAFVNYTPPAPNVVPSSVAMCLGDPAVLLRSSSSSSSTVNFASGTISVVIPDNNLTGATSNLTVSGIPAAASISSMRVTFNINHTWDGDIAVALKAPNNNILNLDYYLSNTGGTGATTGFVNTTISSAGGSALSSGSNPYTGTFKADAFPGTSVPPAGPAGFTPNVTTWPPLYGTPNGTWSLGMVDAFAGDQGTLTSWSINMTYVLGVPATPAVWSPAAGLFSDANATIPYVAGTAVDSVWTRPTPAGVYTYQVTVQSLPAPPLAFANPAPITISNAAAAPANPYPATLSVSGLPTSGVTVKNVIITGFTHTWAGDVNIVLQHPNGTTNVILLANSNADPLINVSNVNLTFSDAATASVPATAPITSGTYLPTNRNGATFAFFAPGPVVTGPTFPASPTLSTFTGNMNGTWKLFVEDKVGGDGGAISGGFSIGFDLGIPACTSPARTVVVTVNQPTTITTQPVDQTICTDKVATFTVVAGGSGPFTYQWQVSTNGGNPPWTNITNGGVYSGATTATLTITAPPVSMSGYQYRVVVTGAAPCASAISLSRILTVNPLPTVVISASPYTSLFPGLVTTLSSTVTPNAASSYTWLRNGAVVAGAITGTLSVNVDGLGDYQSRVTDINGCTNISNIITIKDSVSGRCFIYPNPTSGKFQVRYYSVANNVLPRSLTVYDAKGDRVFTQFYTIGRPYDRMDVDMRAYGKGLYWVEIGDQNGNRLTMCRLVIQ